MSATALLCLSFLATGPRATLELWSEPLGAVVLVDRRPAGATPLRLEILPGLHQVEVCARGHECVLIDHLAESGQAKVLWVGLGRPARLAVGTALASVGGALSAVGLGILLFVGNGGHTEADRGDRNSRWTSGGWGSPRRLATHGPGEVLRGRALRGHLLEARSEGEWNGGGVSSVVEDAGAQGASSMGSCPGDGKESALQVSAGGSRAGQVAHGQQQTAELRQHAFKSLVVVHRAKRVAVRGTAAAGSRLAPFRDLRSRESP